jgi:hypothetical protein
MTPEQRQRLDRRTWQLFNGYLDGPYQQLHARFTHYMAAALSDASGNEDAQIAQAFARIGREEPGLLQACELIRLRARALAVVLECAAWPEGDSPETEQGGH